MQEHKLYDILIRFLFYVSLEINLLNNFIFLILFVIENKIFTFCNDINFYVYIICIIHYKFLVVISC